MQLRPGKSKSAIAYNIFEMMKAGHPHNQAVAAPLRTAGAKKKAAK